MNVFKEYSKYEELYMKIICDTIHLEKSVGENI